MRTHLLIQDERDLLVASAHISGAQLLIANIAYQPEHSRFAIMVQREGAATQTGLHFDYVQRVQKAQLPDEGTLTFTACIFEPTDSPAGVVTLFCDSVPRIRLFVECLDAQMLELES